MCAGDCVNIIESLRFQLTKKSISCQHSTAISAIEEDVQWLEKCVMVFGAMIINTADAFIRTYLLLAREALKKSISCHLSTSGLREITWVLYLGSTVINCSLPYIWKATSQRIPDCIYFLAHKSETSHCFRETRARPKQFFA